MRAALLLFAAGCVQSINVGPPPLSLDDGSEARSLLMLIEKVDPTSPLLDNILLAWVGPSSAPLVLPPFSTARGETTRVHTWLYAEELEELGFVAGEVPLVGAEEDACKPEGDEIELTELLPPAEAAFFVEVAGKEEPRWSRTDPELVATLETLRTRRRRMNPCVGFDMHLGTVDDACPGADCGRRAEFVIATGPDSALMGRIAKRPDGAITGYQFMLHRFDRVDLVSTETAAYSIEALMMGSDRITLRNDGSFTCQREDGARCSRSVPPRVGTSTHAYGALALFRGSLHALTEDGVVYRELDQRWEPLSLPTATTCVPELACEAAGDPGCDQICRIELASRDGRLLALMPHQGAAWHFEDDRFVRDALPPDEQAIDDRAQSLALGAEHAAIGTTRGRLLGEREAGEWEQVATIGRQPVYAVEELGDGFLFGGEDGVIAQYHPDYDGCAELALGFLRITQIVRIGGDYVVAGIRTSGSPQDFVWLERSSRPGDPCNTTHTEVIIEE